MATQNTVKARALRQRLAGRAWRWPFIVELTVRYRAGFAYLDALLDSGDELPLCRLRDTGDPDLWGFALYTVSTGRYEDAVLPTGHPAGTPEEALDWSCGLYLGVPVTARLARGEDLTAAVGIWRQANTARGRPPTKQRVARVADKLADPDALVLVASVGDEVLGMALAEPGRDQDGHGGRMEELCHISMVFVHPDHWGRRIGLLLLEGISGHAKRQGYTHLQVWTGESNDRAQHLYRRAGFTPSGRTLLLGSGEPVLHLARPASLPPTIDAVPR
ncbi:GNAT family N-acetyltransferase [Streptomyces albipurpureus]|uniref:GNAT family N-acetyltransferase n=1 Tax=Streptomyces albipurpureus TaxID=2897419 RepID=A0ABT0UJV4_9ACTN|nr:GNAT family N-acetyltransferase [Streptomyces sp. CWNU-1]MCM2388284.1 GNAT family N-acetyltransferase [Streptomyces sp. CWNU-1]